MFCYRDKTFCVYYKECINGQICDRALTEIVIDKAEKAGMPVCQFVKKPDCFEEK